MKRISALVVALFFLISCGTSKIYEFKSEDVDFEWGIITTYILGKAKKQGSDVIYCAPYRLLIEFKFYGHNGGTIHIDELELLNSVSGKVVFEEENIEGRLITFSKKSKYSYDNEIHASFHDLYLKFEDMELRLKYTLKEGDNVSKGEGVIPFKKDYQSHIRTVTV